MNCFQTVLSISTCAATTRRRTISVNLGEGGYETRSTNAAGNEIVMVVNFLEQANLFVDPGATAAEIVVTKDGATGVETVQTSNITKDVATRIIGQTDTSTLLPGAFFEYRWGGAG
jgi:hypothetical protein